MWISRAESNQDPSALLEQAFERLRELELHLKFFNLVFADILWHLKLLCLSIPILCGFSSIRLIHSNPVLGFLYIVIGFAAIIIYIGMFHFAYKVTEKIEDLLELMEIKSISVVNAGEGKYWARVLRSIPRMGMRVGGFHQVERNAVPQFMDFVITQIVGLLVSF